EVTVRRANMRPRCRARSSPKDKLIAHKLSVILADGTLRGTISGIAGVRTACPLPAVTVKLIQLQATRRGTRMKIPAFRKVSLNRKLSGGVFPFEFRGQPCPGPPRERVGFIVTNMRHRLV